jgi:hypothetical protein
MKATIITVMLLWLSIGSVVAQIDFEEYRRQQQEKFNRHRTQNKARFENYRDSLNSRYADFLEESWKQFTLFTPEPAIKNPITAPPVYDKTKPQPAPEEIKTPTPAPVAPAPKPTPPVVETPKPKPTPVAPAPKPTPPVAETPKPKPIPVAPVPKPIPTFGISATMFGTIVQLSNLNVRPARLAGVAEKGVADYWRSLADIPHREIEKDAMRIKTELALNDWGLYDLLGEMFDTYVPNGSENEKVVFSVFMLNQMGYRAKIGRSGDELIPLIAFDNTVTNCMYFKYGEGSQARYYMINPRHKNLQKVATCAIDYDKGLKNMSLNISEAPKFASAPLVKELAFKGKTYTLNTNKNTTDFYKDYPCVEFSTYAAAPLDPLMLKSIEDVIRPEIADKSQVEAVNWLLHFIQNAFEYQTDATQFGYEKFFFPEETITSLYSDCEDRSILFTQLVRRLLDMPVVLIYYPGVHLATAVKFSDTTLSGDYIMVGDEKYLICDPTYINANIGMSMPDLRNSQVELFM